MAARESVFHKAPISAFIILSGILARLRTRKCDTGRTVGIQRRDYLLAQSSKRHNLNNIRGGEISAGLTRIYKNSGYEGGAKGSGDNLDYVTIVVEKGTNNNCIPN